MTGVKFGLDDRIVIQVLHEELEKAREEIRIMAGANYYTLSTVGAYDD